MHRRQSCHLCLVFLLAAFLPVALAATASADATLAPTIADFETDSGDLAAEAHGHLVLQAKRLATPKARPSLDPSEGARAALLADVASPRAPPVEFHLL